MTRQEAARRQHLRHSFYCVYLCGPNGERELVARTQRKSGRGLLNILASDKVQARVRLLPGVDESTRLTKHADRLEFSNGWRMEFGGTMLQEAE